MKFKKVAAITLAGAMTVSLAACGGSSDSGNSSDNGGGEGGSSVADQVVQPNLDAANTEKTDETLTIGLASEPSTMYGVAAGKTENEEQVIGSALVDSLVKKNYATGEIEPNLATEWEWVDGTHLKFTLRDDVTMSDGTPLVADDVVYSCKNWVELNATNDTGKYLVGAVADDEHTVTIEFNTVAPDFLTMLSWSAFGIVSEDEINAAGGLEGVQTNPVIGSGPYKFKEWKSGQSITLERNEDYWNKDYVGYYKEIVFTFTSDAAAREMAVESGDADIAYDIPVSQAATYVTNDKVNTAIYTFGQETHLWYNMGDESRVTADQKVREAIDKALDFNAIAQVGTAGIAPASDSYWDTSCEFYAPAYTAEERAVDVEGAKALLEEAGYGDGELEVTALGLGDNTPVLTVMQANLAEAGIKLNIDTPDTAQFVEGAFGGGYDIICVGDTPAVRIPANVMPFLQKLNVEGPGMVIGGPKWTTDEIDSTIQEMITESDMAKVTETAAKLDDMMKEQTICSNLYPDMHGVVYAKDLKGLNTIERGYIDVTQFYK